jgi:hypothetical protein
MSISIPCSWLASSSVASLYLSTAFLLFVNIPFSPRVMLKVTPVRIINKTIVIIRATRVIPVWFIGCWARCPVPLRNFLVLFCSGQAWEPAPTVIFSFNGLDVCVCVCVCYSLNGFKVFYIFHWFSSDFSFFFKKILS